MSIQSPHNRLCRLERQRVEMLRLQSELKGAEACIARLENKWWLQRVDGRVWLRTFRQLRQDLYGEVYDELKNVIGNNVDHQTEKKIMRELLDKQMDPGNGSAGQS